MRPTFTERLKKCVSKADLTGADIARWFDRPRATVDTWLNLGRSPMGPAGDAAYADLLMLEWALRHDARNFPVPKRLTPRARRIYLHDRRSNAERNSGLS
jgi:hypothetical protein